MVGIPEGQFNVVGFRLTIPGHHNTFLGIFSKCAWIDGSITKHFA